MQRAGSALTSGAAFPIPRPLRPGELGQNVIAKMGLNLDTDIAPRLGARITCQVLLAPKPQVVPALGKR